MPLTVNDRDDMDTALNEYPEPDVDAMKTQRDLALERYVQVRNNIRILVCLYL